MISIAIIGTGQLGARHLQGLAPCSVPLEIYCVDVSEVSLNRARSYWEESNKTVAHKVYYLKSIDLLPKEVIVAIVASNSDARRTIIENLLKKIKVHYLILEKVLFQDLDDYEYIGELIRKSEVESWVNCPRRLNPTYKWIRTKLANNRNIQFTVSGCNWGLGSNAIHFLDLFAFLTGSTALTVGMECVDKGLYLSKRPGYIELFGTLRVESNQLGAGLISSFQGKESPVYVSVNDGNFVFNIVEGREIRYYDLNSAGEWITEPHSLAYQSMLTYLVVEEILNSGQCSLTKYEESKYIHQSYLSSIIEYYKIYYDKGVKSVPIT